jgi:hypothetical protein
VARWRIVKGFRRGGAWPGLCVDASYRGARFGVAATPAAEAATATIVAMFAAVTFIDTSEKEVEP